MTESGEQVLGGMHAVVTGGGRGIGAAIASALAQRGAAVTIMGRDRAVLEKHAAALGGKAAAIVCDVTQPDAVKKAFDEAVKRSGPVDILVNNAGASKSEKFPRTSMELWNHMLAANLTSTFLCTQQVIPGMLERESGRIVNIASTLGVKGAARMVAYTSAKHGVVGFTRALALEVVKSGITVNAVCPGFTDTEMTQRGIGEISSAKKISRDDAANMMKRIIPSGRFATTDEVAHTVAWLCDPASSAISGQAIVVSGGE